MDSFQEWSGLFVMDGEQGDRVIYHYPQGLQAMQGAAEMVEATGRAAGAGEAGRRVSGAACEGCE